MNEAFVASPDTRHHERGSARVKFIIVVAIVVVVVYMGFQYVPVAYQSYRFKQAMDESTEQASARGNNGEWLKGQIKASANEYGMPPGSYTMSEPVIHDGRLEVTVRFIRPVNILPFWTYNYNFDYTAKSNTFLNAK